MSSSKPESRSSSLDTFMAVVANPSSSPQSPSVSVEKGAYRLRAPVAPRLTHKRTGSLIRPPTVTTQERLVGSVVLLLVLSVLFCFGSAYYLYLYRSVVHGEMAPTSDAKYILLQPSHKAIKHGLLNHRDYSVRSSILAIISSQCALFWRGHSCLNPTQLAHVRTEHLCRLRFQQS